MISLFEAIGLDPIYKRNELRFTCDDTEALIDWMGLPPPGFAYKWAIDSIDRYRELKERADTEHATQTFDP